MPIPQQEFTDEDVATARKAGEKVALEAFKADSAPKRLDLDEEPNSSGSAASGSSARSGSSCTTPRTGSTRS
jgi:hypothetical protein